MHFKIFFQSGLLSPKLNAVWFFFKVCCHKSARFRIPKFCIACSANANVNLLSKHIFATVSSVFITENFFNYKHIVLRQSPFCYIMLYCLIKMKLKKSLLWSEKLTLKNDSLIYFTWTHIHLATLNIGSKLVFYC